MQHALQRANGGTTTKPQEPISHNKEASLYSQVFSRSLESQFYYAAMQMNGSWNGNGMGMGVCVFARQMPLQCKYKKSSIGNLMRASLSLKAK